MSVCVHFRRCHVTVTYCKWVTKSMLHVCGGGGLCVYVCWYKEGVGDRMLRVSSLQHPLCCHGETVLCFPIGGEINTIFNWPGGLPPVWEIVGVVHTHTDTHTESL